jgi:hypothetical protein
MLSANVDIKSVSASALGLESSGTLSSADRLAAQGDRDFLESVPLELLEVGYSLWLQHNGAPAHYGEDIATCPGRWTACREPIA